MRLFGKTKFNPIQVRATVDLAEEQRHTSAHSCKSNFLRLFESSGCLNTYRVKAQSRKSASCHRVPLLNLGAKETLSSLKYTSACKFNR